MGYSARMDRRHALLTLLAAPVVFRATVALAAQGPLVVVHKSEGCSCCKLWVDHLQKAGFSVKVIEESNMGPTKERVGVPVGKASCHTAEVGGYFVEGHVPASDIQRLLREKPKAKGLVVPAMPLGSPGMEVPSGQVDPYDVLIVGMDGSTRVYAHYPKG